MIVVSILLAFGIDAMWAQRQSGVEEREALDALESEFAANLSQVDQVLGWHVEARGRMETLMDLTEAEVRALPRVKVSEIMLATCNPWTFDPQMGTLEALIGSGKLGVLRDAPLRESLTTFQNLVADAAGDAALLEADARDVWSAEVDLGGPWTDAETEVGIAEMSVVSPNFIPQASADDLLRVREDGHFMGLVSRCHINAGYYVTELERLRAQVLVVQNRIQGSR